MTVSPETSGPQLGDAASLDATRAFLQRVSELPGGEKIRACIQCGMCSGICPLGYAMEYGPRRMIAALRAGRIDDLFRSESLWLCVSCYSCTYRCPSGIPLTDRVIAALKEELLVRGVGVPAELQTAFQRTARYGNPFGESPRKRDAWTREAGLNVRVLREGDSAEVLWWVGCFASYNKRNNKDAVALARVLAALGVDFGILGPDERCSGDVPCTNAGEKGLFQLLYEHNTRELSKRRFREVLVGDPHAYNAFANEYRRLGTPLPVKHYTQFLVERLPEVRRLLKREVPRKVTYHDPCCLGRRNGVYEAPRVVLEAIPGLRILEMPRNRENALCCGGGGGAMWLDGFIWERTRTPLPLRRVQEAARTGAEVLAVACPLEISRFEDAVKTAGLEGRLAVRDIASIVAESMGLTEGVRA